MCTGFSFFGAEEDLNSNDDDRSQRLKQGGVVGGSVLIFQGPAKGLRKNQQTQPVRP